MYYKLLSYEKNYNPFTAFNHYHQPIFSSPLFWYNLECSNNSFPASNNSHRPLIHRCLSAGIDVCRLFTPSYCNCTAQWEQICGIFSWLKLLFEYLGGVGNTLNYFSNISSPGNCICPSWWKNQYAESEIYVLLIITFSDIIQIFIEGKS